ncbi:MAG: HisA/HisF-related TIM barrel protein [Methanocella sp.]
MTGTARIIPCLLLQDDSLARTTCFRQPRRIGEPIDVVRMFNRAGADELILLDIMASRKRGLFGSKAGSKPDIDLIARISDECSMPLTYGGGIRTVEDIRDIMNRGVEKVLIGTHAVEDPSFVRRASEVFGSHSIAVAIDAKRLQDGRYEVCTNGGVRPAGIDPVSQAQRMESMGAGEIFLNAIDRDGTLHGYDLWLIESVARAVSIPVIACGGAGSVEDFRAAILVGAASAAAGTALIFRGCRGALQVSYPTEREIDGTPHGTPEAAVAEGRL